MKQILQNAVIVSNCFLSNTSTDYDLLCISTAVLFSYY